jgi:type IV pilus assembly protein PilV
MLSVSSFPVPNQRGSTLLEVLVTVVILAFGLLGLAGMQAKIQLAEMEAYQRAQAILLLSDMIERISANRLQAASYVSSSAYGTGDSQPASCSNVAAGFALDLCEWSNALKGAAEKSGGNNSGAMIGARGCVELVQAPDTTAAVCTPGIYRVTVTWQGLHKTASPSLTCGRGLYGDEAQRRAISNQITIGLPSCS